MDFRVKTFAAVALASLQVILISAFARAQAPKAAKTPELQVLERFIGSREETSSNVPKGRPNHPC
jgi:hypothetical protein